MTTTDLNTLLEGYLKRRDLSYIGLAFTYVLAGVDAFVDAHLMRFDVSDDLSLEWHPSIDYLPNKESAIGFHLSFQPKPKPPIIYPVRF